MSSNEPAEVAGRAPALAADLFAPFPDVAHAVLAEVQDDVARLAFEDVAHQLVRLLQGGPVRVLDDRAVGAPVVLQEVEAPLGESLRVLFLVLVGADVPAAGQGPGRGVDARLQPLGVDVVGQRLHVGEAAVGVDPSLARRAASPPSSDSGRRA